MTLSTQRLDKFLWIARFFRTRPLAVAAISGSSVRINGEHAGKPATALGIGDVLTFAQGNAIRVVRVTGFAERRGNAALAVTLYEDLAPLKSRTLTPEEASAPERHARPGNRARNEARQLKRGEQG